MSTLPKPFDYAPAQSAQDVTFRLHDADPPSPLYIQRDDRLVLQGASTFGGGDTVIVTARLLLAAPPGAPIGVRSPQEVADYVRSAGQSIITIQQTLVLAGNVGATSIAVDLAEGYLLSVSVVAVTAQRRGQTFARVWLQRGGTVAAASLAALVLMADYVSSAGPGTWPGGRVMGSTESSGVVQNRLGNTPVPGADWVFTENNFNRMRVMAVRATLVTSATVANRTPRLEIRDAFADVLFVSGGNVVQVASTTISYTWASGCNPTQVDAVNFLAPLPENFHIVNSSTIRSVTTGLQAADQWQTIVLQGEEWVDSV